MNTVNVPKKPEAPPNLDVRGRPPKPVEPELVDVRFGLNRFEVGVVIFVAIVLVAFVLFALLALGGVL